MSAVWILGAGPAWSRRALRPVIVLGVVLVLAGCTTRPAPPPAARPPELRSPVDAVTVLDATTPAELALTTSRTFFTAAPVVVLAADGDPAGQDGAARTATGLGAPLLLTPPDASGTSSTALGAELRRLGTTDVVAAGAAAGWARAAGAGVTVHDPADPPANPPAGAPRNRSVVVLVLDEPAQRAAAATARSAGAEVRPVAGPDPRRDVVLGAALAGAMPTHVVALGAAFGPAAQLTARLAVAAHGAQLPGGGQVLFPGRLMVALYGHPGAPALGALGEQDLAGSVRRAEALARDYQSLVGEPVVPAFEIIATVADSAPGPDGDYSAESSVEDLRPWVDAARDTGIYVALDLQPGRTDFLTQAKRYAELLTAPNVGLALDPEWRLGPHQVHRVQVGSVTATEVNTVVDWLAGLTRDQHLPQKLLMLHQFRTEMITDRDALDLGRDDLAVLLHADGFGTPGEKFETWNRLHVGAPAALPWGWKNFYHQDRPMFTPAQTLAVGPTAPVFVSYQ